MYQQYQQEMSQEQDKPIDLTRANLARQEFQCQMNAKRKELTENSFQNYASNNLEMGTAANPAGNQMDIIRAAKLLFSKKTRTLYHWMYPNTTKMQLKSAVSLAWDTLGIQEKQFYIGQVLGKFGCLQSRLMINPQLGCMTYPPNSIKNEQIDHNISNLETRSAVSNLLHQQSESLAWMIPPPPSSSTASASLSTRRKRGRPKRSPNQANDPLDERMMRHKLRRMQKKFTGTPKMHHMQNSSSSAATASGCIDDFKDDPELSKELEKFQWAMHMAGDK